MMTTGTRRMLWSSAISSGSSQEPRLFVRVSLARARPTSQSGWTTCSVLGTSCISLTARVSDLEATTVVTMRMPAWFAKVCLKSFIEGVTAIIC